MRIYMTHCSAKKDDSLKNSSKKVTPDKLYKATPTQRFISTCKEKGVQWAIFSDLYGVWFPNIEQTWYEKNPSRVSEHEFHKLLDDFHNKLDKYDEIWFYYNPGRFHPLYKRLLQQTDLSGRVKMFSTIDDIK